MTTFEAIKHLIDEKILTDERMAKKLIFEAYYHDRIDGMEYWSIIDMVEKKWGK